MTNSIKTVLLLGLLTGVLLYGGELLAGQNGLYLGLAFAVAMNFSSYFFSDTIALATYHAQRVSSEQNPDIYRRVAHDADAASAKYTGTPYELISGLQKLESWSKRLPMAATPSTAHLFIIKPRTGSWFQSLWSTHPATEDRIRRLQEMR
jgi:Zn-dependent protease with chaperone function